MTVPRWTTDGTDELRIAPRRKDGTLRRAVPVWIEPIGEGLYAPEARATTLRLVPRTEASE